MNNKHRVFIAGRKLGFVVEDIRWMCRAMGFKPTLSEVPEQRYYYVQRACPTLWNCSARKSDDYRDCTREQADLLIAKMQEAKAILTLLKGKEKQLLAAMNKSDHELAS